MPKKILLGGYTAKLLRSYKQGNNITVQQGERGFTSLELLLVTAILRNLLDYGRFLVIF